MWFIRQNVTIFYSKDVLFTDTLAVLARTVSDMFKPLASQYLQVAIRLLTGGSDPDLKRCM